MIIVFMGRPFGHLGCHVLVMSDQFYQVDVANTIILIITIILYAETVRMFPMQKMEKKKHG